MNTISEITRRQLVEELVLSNLNLYGRYEEADFFGRLFPLATLPSDDSRFKDMAGDLWQHRVNNNDWSDDWWLTDTRLDVLNGSDEQFVRILAEMVHPMVLWDDAHRATLLGIFNKHLAMDGWEIGEVQRVSNRPIYGGRRLGADHPAIAAAKEIAFSLDAIYMQQQIERMQASIAADPELAIGTAKEFIETVCRTILNERSIALPKDDDLPALVKLTVKSLPIVPPHIAHAKEAEKTLIVLVNNLASVGRSLAELRNEFGTGHGKDAGHEGLDHTHARLAVGVATAAGVFLFESHQK